MFGSFLFLDTVLWIGVWILLEVFGNLDWATALVEACGWRDLGRVEVQLILVDFHLDGIVIEFLGFQRSNGRLGDLGLARCVQRFRLFFLLNRWLTSVLRIFLAIGIVNWNWLMPNLEFLNVPQLDLQLWIDLLRRQFDESLLWNLFWEKRDLLWF